jgi:uncharacterized BrkB/YihY/UPF0761 family membrane protein
MVVGPEQHEPPVTETRRGSVESEPCGAEPRRDDRARRPEPEAKTGVLVRIRERAARGARWAEDASARHVTVAVPFRAAERNRRVAASVLAGGVAYRFFLWLLPFGLIVGGALGLANAASVEDALEAGGMSAAVVDALGDIARASDASSWWLLIIGLPLLGWAGYTGAKALQLIHALIWDEPPPRTKPLAASLVFTAACCAFTAAVMFAWWVRDDRWFVGLALGVVATLPLAALWLWISLRLPHGTASWKALVPGALVVAVGFQALHGATLALVVPKLEKSTSLYGGLGAVATVLFFMYLAARLVVTAPILNSALHDELRRGDSDELGDVGFPPFAGTTGRPSDRPVGGSP